ncbi:MAG TPA: hypothetical protein DEA52_05855 [Clostridiaceae bacterium]|nr:hypothetical protein [Clostridiaceae bacterium]
MGFLDPLFESLQKERPKKPKAPTSRNRKKKNPLIFSSFGSTKLPYSLPPLVHRLVKVFVNLVSLLLVLYLVYWFFLNLIQNAKIFS